MLRKTVAGVAAAVPVLLGVAADTQWPEAQGS
jgi:hypothetical protein